MKNKTKAREDEFKHNVKILDIGNEDKVKKEEAQEERKRRTRRPRRKRNE